MVLEVYTLKTHYRKLIIIIIIIKAFRLAHPPNMACPYQPLISSALNSPTCRPLLAVTLVKTLVLCHPQWPELNSKAPNSPNPGRRGKVGGDDSGEDVRTYGVREGDGGAAEVVAMTLDQITLG